MEKAVIIDWLSFTAHATSNKIGYITQPWESGLDAKPDTPRFGYRRAVRYSSGAVVMFDGSTDTMGAHYVYSGQALANLDEVFQDGGQHVLRWHMDQGHKCTRIDLAIDVFDDASFLPQIRGKAERNEFSGTARTATIVSSSDGAGLTVYVGSRSSERFVRVYNKAAQTGTDRPWTRIECEVKGDSARAVGGAVLHPDNGGLALVAQSVIRRVVDFDCKAWQEILSGEQIAIGTPKIEERQTEAWILGQVAKAVAKFEVNYPEKRIIERLWRAIDAQLDARLRE